MGRRNPGGEGSLEQPGRVGRPVLVERGESGQLGLGHPEPGVGHAERFEELGPQVLVEGLAREDLDQAAHDVGGESVVPVRARVELQRVLRQQRGHALERLPRTQRVAGLLERGVDGVAGEQGAGQAGHVHQHVAHVHRSLGLDQLDAVVLLDHADLQRAPLGDVAVHRVEQLEHAPLVELHQGDRCDGLRHGEDAEDGVVCHRDALLAVHESQRAVIGDVPTPRHRDLAPGDLAGVHIGGAEVVGDALEAAAVHSRCVRFDLHGVAQAFCCFCSRR